MRRWLFITARNFGDALLARRLIDAVAASFPEDQIEVLTRPQFQEFFTGRPGVCAVHTAMFPMGTVKEFGAGAALRLLCLCLRLRQRHYDWAVNTTGDLRETFLAWLVGPRLNAAPVWAVSHPLCSVFRSRGANFFINRVLPIPGTMLSIYAAHDEMARQMGCSTSVIKRLSEARPERGDFQQNLIGLHPFATQEFKLWNWSSWIVLMEQLLAGGLRVRVFCSPQELSKLKSNLGAVASNPCVEFVAGNLEEFFMGLREVSVVVGLDSFVMHAAYALGVPAVLVNGPNDYRVWGPPGVPVISNEGNCPRHPCSCKPTCGDGIVPLYICIRAISPSHVFAEIRATLSREMARNCAGRQQFGLPTRFQT
jgi:heptosyltransferase-3